VIRDVLANTEGLTNVIGSGNQVSPWAQEAAMAQDTIATRMSQLAIGYRDSPLSATYSHEGLHAGDRVPDMPVRYHSEGGAGWQERTLFSLLKFFTPTAVETNKKYADFGAVTIDGVGHHPMLEKPDEFNRKLRDVLKEFATKK